MNKPKHYDSLEIKEGAELPLRRRIGSRIGYIALRHTHVDSDVKDLGIKNIDDYRYYAQAKKQLRRKTMTGKRARELAADALEYHKKEAS